MLVVRGLFHATSARCDVSGLKNAADGGIVAVQIRAGPMIATAMAGRPPHVTGVPSGWVTVTPACPPGVATVVLEFPSDLSDDDEHAEASTTSALTPAAPTPRCRAICPASPAQIGDAVAERPPCGCDLRPSS